MLAVKASLSGETIARLERAVHPNPTLWTASRLAEALGVALTDLFPPIPADAAGERRHDGDGPGAGAESTPALPDPAPASAPARRSPASCSACGAALRDGPDQYETRADPGVCRECDEDICSWCAASYDVDGGYGEDGRDVRVRAICRACAVAKVAR